MSCSATYRSPRLFEGVPKRRLDDVHGRELRMLRGRVDALATVRHFEDTMSAQLDGR